MILRNNRPELKLSFFFDSFLVSSPVHSVNNPKGIDRKFMFASQQQKVDALIDFLTFWHNNEKCCLCRKFNRIREREMRKKDQQR